MGLFQNLLETYDKCTSAVGIVQVDADGNANERKTLLPIFHTTFNSEICVTIDEFGRLVNVTRDSKGTTIIIPCTEESAGRTVGIAAHPLCDQIDYVGGIIADKAKAYLSGLVSWKSSNVILNSIYSYVLGRTLINDLINYGVFKGSEYQSIREENFEKQLDYEKIRKIGVRFIVHTNGLFVKVWEDQDLRNAWINHILGLSMCKISAFDYLSGIDVSQIAEQHPKNIYSSNGTSNAKLLSCNDTSGFTFRGRFTEQNDAVIVDYVQSQKMHQMLRWLIANYGYVVDSQVIVTWAIDSIPEVKAKASDNSLELFCDLEEVKIDQNVLMDVRFQVYDDYAKKLKELLQGYGNKDSIKQHARKIAIAVFDAATPGRMGLVFYQELPEDAYLENIVNWHNDTSYYLTSRKKVKDDKGKDAYKPVCFIGAPSYDDILFAVYGKSRGDKSYGVLQKKIRKQLLECMFGNFVLPKSLVTMASNRVSRPMSFTDLKGKFIESDWKQAMNITCALARKHYKQNKEGIELELDTGRTDRDYLYGRLLSVADRIERTALYVADKQDSRTTNALRLMSAFQIKPYTTWGQLYSSLIPYRNQMNGAGYYQSLIDSVLVLFKQGEYENNSPLSPLYLLGYSAQNRAFYGNQEKGGLGGNDNDDIKKQN